MLQFSLLLARDFRLLHSGLGCSLRFLGNTALRCPFFSDFDSFFVAAVVVGVVLGVDVGQNFALPLPQTCHLRDFALVFLLASHLHEGFAFGVQWSVQFQPAVEVDCLALLGLYVVIVIGRSWDETSA